MASEQDELAALITRMCDTLRTALAVGCAGQKFKVQTKLLAVSPQVKIDLSIAYVRGGALFRDARILEFTPALLSEGNMQEFVRNVCILTIEDFGMVDKYGRLFNEDT